MPFTVFGPGVQDQMSSRQLFPTRGVEDVEEVAPFPRIHGSEEADEGTEGWPLPSRQRSRGQQARAAYGEAEHPSTEPERVETAAEIMSAPVATLNRDASVADAWEFFHRHSFRHLPILDDAGNLVGILSDRDLLRQAAAIHGDPEGGIDQFIVERVLTATPD
ncbi:MAG: HPP family protein, partial [Thiohalospira sp.]